MTNDQWGSPNKDDQNQPKGNWNADNSGADGQAQHPTDQPTWQSGTGWDGSEQPADQGWQQAGTQPSADQWQQPADQGWQPAGTQPSADQWQQPADQGWQQAGTQPSADQAWQQAGSQPSADQWPQPADQGWNQQAPGQFGGYEATQSFQPQGAGGRMDVGKDASGFFAALFDFSFTKFVTPSIVKFMYVLVTVVVALYVIIMIIVGFTADTGIGIMSIIVAPIVGIVLLGLFRMQMEFMVAAVRTAENTSEMKDQLKNR